MTKISTTGFATAALLFLCLKVLWPSDEEVSIANLPPETAPGIVETRGGLLTESKEGRIGSIYFGTVYFTNGFLTGCELQTDFKWQNEMTGVLTPVTLSCDDDRARDVSTAEISPIYFDRRRWPDPKNMLFQVYDTRIRYDHGY